MIKEIIKKKSVKNAGWLIGGKMAQMPIKLLVGILSARYLGPSNYGIINYVDAYTAFFMAFCILGINSVLVKEFINHPDDEGTILGTSLVLRAVSSFLSLVMIVSLVAVIDADRTIIMVAALCSISLLFNIFEVFNFWFQAKLKSKVTAIVALIAYTITSAYKLFLLFSNQSIVWFAMAMSVDYIVVALLMILAYKHYHGKKLAFSLQYGKSLLKISTPFIFPGIMVAVYTYTNKFLLKHIMSEADVGFFSTAVAICGMWTFILSAIIDSAVPLIMEARKDNIKLYEKRNKQLYAIIFYVSFFASVIISAGAPLIISILYGSEYSAAVNPLRIITWYTAFAYLGAARNAWVVCENKQSHLKYLYLASAVLNILLNLLFIPLFGASGAALASLLTQIATIVIPLFIKDMRRNTIMIFQAIALRGIGLKIGKTK